MWRTPRNAASVLFGSLVLSHTGIEAVVLYTCWRGLRKGRTSKILAKLSKRKPRLLLRFVGALLLRFAERTFLALLFQLPPRFTRFVLFHASTPPPIPSKKRWRNGNVCLPKLCPSRAALQAACLPSDTFPARYSAVNRRNPLQKRCFRAAVQRNPLGKTRTPKKRTPSVTGQSLVTDLFKSKHNSPTTISCSANKASHK